VKLPPTSFGGALCARLNGRAFSRLELVSNPIFSPPNSIGSKRPVDVSCSSESLGGKTDLQSKEFAAFSARRLLFFRPGIAATSETPYSGKSARRTFPGKPCVGPLSRFFQPEGRMWGFLIGLYVAVIVYPYLQEWQQRRANKALLAKMRKHHAAGHQWDVRKGQWRDE
jgi:hypothetical protein